MTPYHEISDATVTEDTLNLTVDGKRYQFLFSDISPKLRSASKPERERLEISPSGYGIHWPLLDEDLSIDGLLGIAHEVPSKRAA